MSRRRPAFGVMTARDRADAAALWQQLVAAALAGDRPTLERLANPALNWPSPAADRSDSWVLFALPRVILAWLRGAPDQAAAARPMLSLVALRAQQVLEPPDGAPDPIPPPPLRQRPLPYKDD